MITNERQYRIMKAQLSKVSEAIDAFNLAKATAATGNKVFARAQLEALQSEQESLSAQLAEYEALKAGELTSFEANSLEELPELLIKARIARGLSQKALAERLELKEQQIKRYEADSYRSASLERLSEGVRALGLRLRGLGSIAQTESYGGAKRARSAAAQWKVAEARRKWPAGKKAREAK